MEIVRVPSLQFAASVRIAREMWSTKDMHKMIYNFDYKRGDEVDWGYIRDAVADGIDDLYLPECFDKGFLYAISIVGWQIFIFCKHDVKCRITSVKELCWGPDGCLDKRESLLKFVKNENYPALERFRVACFHCLEEHIHDFWDIITDDNVQALLSQSMSPRLRHDGEMMVYWLKRRGVKIPKKYRELDEPTGGRRNLHNTNERVLFLSAIRNGNELACKYLWEMKPRNKRANKGLVFLTKIAVYDRNPTIISKHRVADVILYFISQMNDKRKMKLYRGTEVLGCYMEWPHTQYFLQYVHLVSNFATQEIWLHLLKVLVSKDRTLYMDYDYSSLIVEYIDLIPSDLKVVFVSDVCKTMYYGIGTEFLFKVGSISFISSLLVNAKQEDKDVFFLSRASANVCVKLAAESKWKCLSRYLDICVKPRSGLEERDKFRTRIHSLLSWRVIRLGIPEGESTLRKILDLVDTNLNA